MKQKRTIYSLLLTSFMLVFAFSYSMAQQVTVESKSSALRCVSDVLNITVDNPMDIAAFEIVLEVSSTADGAFFDNLSVAMDPGLGVLTNHVIDLSGVDNVSPDTIRIAGMLIDAGDACLSAGVTTVAQVSYTTNDVCSGTVTIAGATLNSACGIDPSTGFVECGTLACIPATVNDGVVTIVNSPPSIDPIADATVHWGSPYNSLATGDDNDDAACENLQFFKVSGPSALSVATSGAISWSTTGPDVGTHVVEVEIKDRCGATAMTSFSICVNNDAPSIACPTEVTNLIWGNAASGSVTGSDPDGGPSPLAYSVASFDGPGSVSIDPASGDWTWQTAEDNSYIGDFELCIAVTDGANIDPPCSITNADTCCVNIHVIPTIRATIESTDGTHQGRNEIVSINLDGSINPANEMGGYDILVKYDASAMTLTSVAAGDLVTGCGWEYFTYRFGPYGNCGDGCPSGIVRVVAIAETNNIEGHPACYAGGTGLADLNFLVTNGHGLECQFIPIRFIWYDCGDNAFSSRTGDSLFISRHVYDWTGADLAGDAPFPSLLGANSTCDVALGDGMPDPIRLVDLWNGGISIACGNTSDVRGDINLNLVAYEIADAVLYSNYFVSGLSVFVIDLERQIAASDVNADNLTLTVADLVYLIRVVVGDAPAYPKEVTTASANYIHTNSGIMSVNNSVAIGAAYVVVEGNAVPQLLADDMEMKYNFDGANTRILVYSIEGNSFTGDFLNVQGDLVSIEMATRDGSPVSATLIPTEYSLKQNYPNPFNPKTTIVASLAEAGDYELSIYNVNGRRVASFSGHNSAGQFEIDWDASEMASGLYFYRLVTNNFTDTKKMVLLK